MEISEKEKNQDAMRAASRALLTAKPETPVRENVQRLTAGLWARPFHSDALGVHPDQIPEATQALRSAGVMADFDKEGRLIVTSDKQYREAAKACGLWDGRDGYGGGKQTGRDRERSKQEFRKAVMRGDYD